MCYASTRETVLMVPARTSCPTSWTGEYSGYIMSARVSDTGRSSYICVDQAYEPAHGSQGQTSGTGHLDHVEVNCNTMPCPPYVNYKELTCVVCTK